MNEEAMYSSATRDVGMFQGREDEKRESSREDDLVDVQVEARIDLLDSRSA